MAELILAERPDIVAIANAVRAKTGETKEMTLGGIVSTINEIQVGTELPNLTNEGSASDLLSGKQLIDQDGNIITGTMPNNDSISTSFDGINNKSYTVPAGYTSGGTVSLDNTIDNEADTQTEIINQIAAVLETKAGGSGDTSMEDNLVTMDFTSYTNSRVTSVGQGAFALASALTSVDFENVKNIGNNAFYSCTSLTKVSFPACTSIDGYAFSKCTSLTSVSLPACTSIGSYAFDNCNRLTSVSLPACTSIGSWAFNCCTSLTKVSFPACTYIGNYAFRNCRILSSLTLGASTVCVLSHASAFYSTPIGGYSTYCRDTPYIYVPASLVDSYQTATNWTYFSSYIRAIGGNSGGSDDMEM